MNNIKNKLKSKISYKINHDKQTLNGKLPN